MYSILNIFINICSLIELNQCKRYRLISFNKIVNVQEDVEKRELLTLLLWLYQQIFIWKQKTYI